MFIACFQPVHQEQLDRFTWHQDPPPCRVLGTRTSYLSTWHATGSSLLYLDRYQYHCVYFLSLCLSIYQFYILTPWRKISKYNSHPSVLKTLKILKPKASDLIRRGCSIIFRQLPLTTSCWIWLWIRTVKQSTWRFWMETAYWLTHSGGKDHIHNKNFSSQSGQLASQSTLAVYGGGGWL